MQGQNHLDIHRLNLHYVTDLMIFLMVLMVLVVDCILFNIKISRLSCHFFIFTNHFSNLTKFPFPFIRKK